MFCRADLIRRRISNFLLLPLIGSFIFSLTPIPTPDAVAANALCASGAAAQNSISVEPSHGKVFYIDTGVNPRLDAAYVGYRVTNNTGSSITNGWVSLSNFTGGAVTLSNADDQFYQLPTIANGETKTAYFLLKATVSSKVAQTHTVKVWRGRPDVANSTNSYICDFSFTKVAETIKAAANKVTSISVDDSTPELGQLIKVTAQGATGTIGDGSPDVGRILWFSPSAFSNFPTAAVKLESVKIVTADNNNFNNSSDVRIYDDRLLVTPTISPNASGTVSYTVKNVLGTADNLVGKRYYRNEYSFRVVGTTAQGIPVQPVAQISSGTQIKHTDIAQTPSASLATNSVTISLTVTKSASIPNPAVTATINSVAYQEVNYTVTIDNTAASGTVTVDEIVDTPGNGVLYKSNSVRVGGSSYTEPVQLSSEANLSPQPYHFVGPFNVAFNANTVITYTMYIPTATDATYSNTAVGYIGNQAVGASSSTVSGVGVVVSGGTANSANPTTITINPAAVTLPATSIGTTSATLNGTVDGNGQTPSAVFEWSTNSNLSSYTTINASDSVAGSDPVSITSAFTGTAGTTYYYRIVAIKNGTRYPGDIQNFTLIEPAAAAVAVTQNASGVQTTSAYLNGSIDPNMQTITQVRFRYGTNSDLSGSTTKILYELAEDGSETTTAIQLTGANPIDLQWQLTGLTQGTVYYYRIEGDYTSGTAQTALGSIVSFKPGSLSQTITFATITDQSFSTGTYDINATASSTLDVSYRSESPTVCSVNAVTGVVTFLKVGFCAITASQPGDSTYSAAEDVTRQFEILASAPTATTQAASSVSKTTATLNGSITTGGGASTTVTFVYSTNSDLSSGSTVTAAQSPLSADGNVTYSLSGLTANTRYYFKVVGQNSHSTVSGSTLDFTTEQLTAATVTAADKSKSYLASTPTFTISTTGLVNPDSISSVTYTFSKNNSDGYDAYGPSTTAPTDSGIYTITPSAAVFGVGNSGDYTITYNTGTYTISKINQAALSLSGASLQPNATTSLNATGGSGTGNVTYSVTTGTCTLNGTTLSANAAEETCTVTATKAADRNYNQQTTTADFVVSNAPSATTNSASNVRKNGARLNGAANQALTSPKFCLKSASFTNLTDCTTGGGTEYDADGDENGYTFDLSSLLPSTTYHYVLYGGAGNSNYAGTVKSFKTLPSVVTNRGSSVSARSAVLNGTVSEPLTDPRFCYRATSFANLNDCLNGGGVTGNANAIGNLLNIVYSNFVSSPEVVRGFVVDKDPGIITSPQGSVGTETTYTLSVVGLSPNTVYYFIIYGTVDTLPYDGGVQSFTTPEENAGGGGGGVVPSDPPPAITSISRTLVCSISNDIIIYGSNLLGATVKLDGVVITLRSESATSLVVTLPTGTLGSKVLIVTTAYGTVSANINYVASSKPKYVPIRIPYLSQGVAIYLDIQASDATSYRLVGKLPSGLTFNNTTGVISGTPTENGVFVFDLIATGPCGDTTTVLELDIDAPTPNAISHRINFLPNSCTITDSAKESFERFIDKVKGISPRNIIPDIYISGGYKESDPNGPLAQCRQEALCGVLLVEDLLGEILTDVFSGSENRIEIIVYWERPTDDEI